MTTQTTIQDIVSANSWSHRIQQIRLVPQKHGTVDSLAVYSAVAREVYMPYLTPEFAYIHEAPFYETNHFFAAYNQAFKLTEGFTRVSDLDLEYALTQCPCTLLVFRTMLGFTKDEFAHSTQLVSESYNLIPLTTAQIETLERSSVDFVRPSNSTAILKAKNQTKVAALTISMIMNGSLFGDAPPGSKSKQSKPDTREGWDSIRTFATDGVPLSVFLHQRHYGGAFRQVLDATSTQRGDLIEDSVQALFVKHGISFIRTGSHNQADIARRFEVHTTPAPDFVVFDPIDDSLKAIIECKGTNNGGTARDKALRFKSLKSESIRLGGIPLIAVLSGIGWARINDALGPVVRDTDGRVFTLSTLDSMLEITPFTALLAQSKYKSTEKNTQEDQVLT